MQTGLNKKRVVISEAASGIGKATAMKFAEEKAELFLLDRDSLGLEETAHLISGSAHSVHNAHADLSTADGVNLALQALLPEGVPTVDVSVNNIGVAGGLTFDHHYRRSPIILDGLGKQATNTPIQTNRRPDQSTFEGC
jgi:NADP-dependent 3-hydroxy acid dehydrogenase YdfG